MPRGPNIPQDVIDRIEALWVLEPTRPVTQIWDKTANFKLRPSLRKTQQIVKAAKAKAKPAQIEPLIIPWGEGWPEDPEDIECLFQLLRISDAAVMGEVPFVKLNRRVAKWALRLRRYFNDSVLAGNNGAAAHLLWAGEYASRERVKEVLSHDRIRTEDLDGFFQWRAMDSQEQFTGYKEAVEAGLVPPFDADRDLEDGITLDTDLPNRIIGTMLEILKLYQLLDEAGAVSEEDREQYKFFEREANRMLSLPAMNETFNRILAMTQRREDDGNETRRQE